MIVVLPYCKDDAVLAAKVMKICRKLDGKRDGIVVLSSDVGYVDQDVYEAAKQAFSVVNHIHVPIQPIRAWPRPHNNAFAHTARQVADYGQPWLWLEPDAVPVKRGWKEAIESEYANCGKPFAGPIVNNGRRYMAGVAVYPANTRNYMQASLNPAMAAPWDVAAATYDGLLNRCADIGYLIKHVYDTSGKGKHFDTLEEVDDEVGDAVVYHRCSDGSLHDLLVPPDESGAIEQAKPSSKTITVIEGANTFYHSGDLGDIIYALPAVKALGGGVIYLGPDKREAPFMCREIMTQKRADAIIPLLMAQPYIEHAEFVDYQPDVDYDLNQFRNLIYAENFAVHMSWCLARLPLKWFGLPHWLAEYPWLTAKPSRHGDKTVIIARSSRYHGDFDWRRAWNAYGDKAAFIGSKQEHIEFQKAIGAQVEYVPTANLLEAASLIAGADVFVGNQSCPFAIAMGLGQNAILEHNVRSPNCKFYRGNMIYGGIDFPQKWERIKLNGKKKLDFVTICDGHSGLGQMAHEHIQMASRWVDLNVVPTRKDAKWNPPYFLSDKRQGNRCVTVEAALEVPKYMLPGDIVMTMWESTRLPQATIDALQNAAAIIVPCAWNASTFSAVVDKPIHIVHLGIDQSVYNCIDRKPVGDVLRFGCAGRFSKSFRRKNLQKIVNAFLAAFEGKDDVALDVKGWDNSWLETHGDKRITPINDFWTHEQMADWYKSLYAFVNVSAGGGWELHPHQAMACGALPIGTIFGGQAEFMTADNSLAVDFTMVDATGECYDGMGMWSEPVFDSLVEAFRASYKMSSQTWIRKTKAASAKALSLTWDNAGEALKKELGRYV